VNAIGGKFHRPDECGCVDMQYALRVRIRAILLTGNFIFNYGTKGADAALPLFIPIHFEGDGSLSGEAMVNSSTTNYRPGLQVFCAGTGGQLIRLVATGQW
jgi:hypothetical protein